MAVWRSYLYLSIMWLTKVHVRQLQNYINVGVSGERFILKKGKYSNADEISTLSLILLRLLSQFTVANTVLLDQRLLSCLVSALLELLSQLCCMRNDRGGIAWDNSDWKRVRY